MPPIGVGVGDGVAVVAVVAAGGVLPATTVVAGTAPPPAVTATVSPTPTPIGAISTPPTGAYGGTAGGSILPLVLLGLGALALGAASLRRRTSPIP